MASVNLNDRLDDLYFHLPIVWGDQTHLAREFGVCRETILRWLKRLEAEGIAKRVRYGWWAKCYDWSKVKEK